MSTAVSIKKISTLIVEAQERKDQESRAQSSLRINKTMITIEKNPPIHPQLKEGFLLQVGLRKAVIIRCEKIKNETRTSYQQWIILAGRVHEEKPFVVWKAFNRPLSMSEYPVVFQGSYFETLEEAEAEFEERITL